MGLIKILLISVLYSLIFASNVIAGWSGPVEIVIGKWGKNSNEFGLLEEDTSDTFPALLAVLNDGSIIIEDNVNQWIVVYDQNSLLLKVVPWYIYQNESKIINTDYRKYNYSQLSGYK